jgi:hypothetical protein
MFKITVYIFALIGFCLVGGYFAVRIGLTNQSGVVDNQQSSFITDDRLKSVKINLDWAKNEEWNTLKQAIVKDAGVIYRASYDAGIDPRLLVAIIVPEQLRLFRSERVIFEKVFSPLKILGNQSQFSWGIMGIKQETAKEIENNLKDSNSDFYLGTNEEGLLDFVGKDIDEERFTRLTNEKDHYYGYLYAGLYVRQIIAQWKKAGIDISQRPAIIATLYNIGFKNSIPKEKPLSGGSVIEIGKNQYSFGSLAGFFYYSDELKEQFPRAY